MEELIQKIDELINTINENSVPKGVTIAGIVIPILISAAVAVFAILQHFQNVRLQRIISNRDYKVQMHADILKIYDDFCLAQNALGGSVGAVHSVFACFLPVSGGLNLPTLYVNNLNAALNVICQAANRAKLLLPKEDENIRNMIEDTYEKFKKLKFKVDEYFYNGIAYNVADSAWNKILSNGIIISKWNYYELNNNRTVYGTFLEYCKTATTQEIDAMTQELHDLFTYDKFDVYFEKYLQMNLMEGKR